MFINAYSAYSFQLEVRTSNACSIYQEDPAATDALDSGILASDARSVDHDRSLLLRNGLHRGGRNRSDIYRV